MKEKELKKKENKKEIYYSGVGRRKSSVAQVRIYGDEKATDSDIVVNNKKLKQYFPALSLQNSILLPLKVVGVQGKFSASVMVCGGGFHGQADAVRLGISRALVKFNSEFKKTLKDAGLLTRDSREVERKKPGLKKARRAPQWKKR